MADYDWFDRSESQDSIDARTWGSKGFHAVWGGGYPSKIQFYRCLRGCGLVVWSPEEHIKWCEDESRAGSDG